MTKREREIKLTAPLGFRMPELSDADGGLTSGPVETIELDAVYYDTDDLRLSRTGASLRHRNDEGWVVKLPNGSDDHGVLDRSEHGFQQGDEGDAGQPPAAALDLVRGIVRSAAVAPVARLRTTRRSIRVYALDGTTIAELTDDDVEVRDGDHLVDRFRELEIELDEDMPAERVEEILERLRLAGARAPEPTPKIVRALGPRAQNPPDVTPIAVDKHARVEEVVRAALSDAVAKLVAHDAGARTGDDPEDIHQVRVATRRLRSHLRTFRSLFDERWAQDLRAELQWLGELLGAVRDAEVLKGRLDAKVEHLHEGDREAAKRLLVTLDDARDDGRRTLLDAMRSTRYLELLDRLVAGAAHPRFLLRVDEADDHEQLRELARRPWKHLRTAIDDLADDPPDEQLHAVRKKAKRARYALEAVGPAFGKPARRLAKEVTNLQDVLGEHQDATVAGQWLRDAAAATGEEALGFVAGQLAAMEREDAERSRAAWPGAWRDAGRKSLHRWLSG